MSEELQVSPTIPLSPAMENQVREKRGPGLLFSCVPCTQPREGGLCPFFQALILGCTLPLHGWPEIQRSFPSSKKCHCQYSKATELMAVLQPRQMELQNWVEARSAPAWALGLLPQLWRYQESGAIGTWRACHWIENHTVSFPWNCLWNIGLAVVYKRPSKIHTIWNALQATPVKWNNLH